MIYGPRTRAEHDWLRQMFKDGGEIGLTESAHILTWLRNGEPVWLVAYDGWLGSTCQMHMLARQSYVPKTLRYAAFNYAFNLIHRTRVFGIVNSKNERAMRLDKWLGFTEYTRFPGCHDEGGDIVILSMTAEEWNNGNRQKLPSAS